MRKNTTQLVVAALFFLFANGLHAQVQNALDFDNVDDEVTVPGASTLITGSSAMSITAWVYPANTNIAFPDYDGYCGFRNNTDADFYLVQHGNGMVEARFRNNAGVAHDIVYSNIPANMWHHFALTYNGSTLILYIDGVEVGFTAATGYITNVVPFYLGTMPYSTFYYRLLGKLDEVTLWSKALSSSEVLCAYQDAIDPASADLKLYYRLDQGIANGTNTSVTTADDLSNHIDGNLTGFGLSGNSSNWVGGVNNTTIIYDTICQGEIYQFGNQALTTSGVYEAAYSGSNTCDSIVVLGLYVKPVNTIVNQSGIVLTAAQAGATYQWLNCNTGFSIINGATTQSFTPTANGSYAVIVSYGGCSDTSACKTVTTVGIDGNAAMPSLNIYPNPAAEQLNIDGLSEGTSVITITDLSGRVVYNSSHQSGTTARIQTSGLETGMYILFVINNGKTGTFRFSKQQ